MPEVDGYSATREIRANEALAIAGGHTPIVALSAQVAGIAGDEWFKAGMDVFITKPFTSTDLVARVVAELTALGFPPTPLLADAAPERSPDDAARALSGGQVAEWHSPSQSRRRECPMNGRRRFDGVELSDETMHDIVRILGLWAEARARFGSGGPFLFGSFGAADIFYAPVVSRFISYQIVVPGFAAAYMQAVWEHEWMRGWIDAAENEDWVIEQYETVA